jgi:hypothetical protein
MAEQTSPEEKEDVKDQQEGEIDPESFPEVSSIFTKKEQIEQGEDKGRCKPHFLRKDGAEY